MKTTYLILLLVAATAKPGTHDQCENADGNLAHQDQPCQDGRVEAKKTENAFDNSQFKQSMLKTLAKMTGQSEADLQDPKVRQAAEILAATDAAKSYAYMKIYGVSAQFCAAVKNDLAHYQQQAAAVIELGAHYYTHGITAQIDGKDLSKTGQELTKGLNDMLDKLEREHQSASEIRLQAKCREASTALQSLARLYAN